MCEGSPGRPYATVDGCGGVDVLGRFKWTTVVPLVALVVLAPTWGTKPGGVVLALVGVFLAERFPAAVYHAEVIAHRVGEPFGSLVLAVAVTVIEVALIVTLMVSADSDTSTLARDTVFAAVMLTCNAIVGLSLLAVTLRGDVATFSAEGSATALATVLTLATLSLVAPTVTTSRPGPEFSSEQLTFAAVASLALYLLFVFVQTVRHRDYFVEPASTGDGPPDDDGDIRRIGRRSAASGCCSSRSLPSSGWPRWSRRPSRMRWKPSALRSLPSAW